MGRNRSKGRDITGLLILDKPTGRGSNESLQIVKRLFQARKAGHTGSLDRLACGLLPICLGEATKVSGFLLNADKRYLTTVRLGEQTTTGDAEGEVIASKPVPELNESDVKVVLAQFRGEIEQVPPMFSAVKVQGQRLYKLAHQGKTIKRSARKVTIHDISLDRLEGADLHIAVHCSKGTYIRTLAEDIGAKLGCGGRVDALRRISAGPFEAAQMVTLEELHRVAEEGLDALDALLLPAEYALAQLPKVEVPQASAFYLRQGQPVLVPHAPTEGCVRLFFGEHDFLGVGEVLDDGRIGPRRLFKSPSRNRT